MVLVACLSLDAAVPAIAHAQAATPSQAPAHAPAKSRVTNADHYPSRAAALTAYWTPQREKKVLAAHPDVVQGLLSAKATNPQARKFLADVPSGTTVKSAAVQVPAQEGDDDLFAGLRSKIGLLLFEDSAGNANICTAFSISPGQNAGLIQTAAHCVKDAHGWSQNTFFIPEYGVSWDAVNNVPTGPWGGFAGDGMWSGLNDAEIAQQNIDISRDFAFINIDPNPAGQRLVDAVGALATMRPNNVEDEFVADVFGYQSGDAGQPGLTECTDPGAEKVTTNGLETWLSSFCVGSPGNSGGPIFVCVQTCDNTFQTPFVVGNTAWSNGQSITSGPMYNGAVLAMWEFAQGGLAVPDPNNPPTVPTDPDHDELLAIPSSADSAPQPASRTAYYTSWSIYANNFPLKDLDTRGAAGKLTTLNYAFENIDPVNLTCFAANKAGSSDESDTTGNDGASDAWADYQVGFNADNSVDGSTDAWDQPLKGNFNQLKQLKAKHPNLKVLLSLGGWTYSKYFSDVAATDASRKKFVSSCIDLYIKGNLPVLDGSPAGGQGAAAGIFDGFDIDWEFPASGDGHAGNHFSDADTANYAALLQEFRTQLDALGGKHYSITAALPAGPTDIAKLPLPQLSGVLDMADVMTYDMHGAWEGTGPTNFNAPLTNAQGNPAFAQGLDVSDTVYRYVTLGGFPASKLSIGIPFYARGWSGVPDGGQHGLYQPATAPSPAFPLSQQPGVAFYKELKDAGKLNGYWMDGASKSTWAYDGTNWWSVETPQSISYKLQFVHDQNLGGVMMFSLEGDDANSSLLNASVGITQ
ncbi:glycosyl hydrolase family 18 protein [Amycolatopsis sp. NPDC001319]|uniref:glycosyl hydrolase family 18 protein n=1 Tax=unclassified Amycolatopsis TaxID=2618356 RepID=UPI0036B0B86F